MAGASRIGNANIARKVMPADEAAALIPNGANVGMSGFTGSGYPKELPAALARRITNANARGERFKVACGLARRPAPNWTACSPPSTASNYECLISRIR